MITTTKALKLNTCSFVKYLIIFFLQRRSLSTKFLFTICHHLIIMFYVYKHLSIMTNLKVKD